MPPQSSVDMICHIQSYVVMINFVSAFLQQSAMQEHQNAMASVVENQMDLTKVSFNYVKGSLVPRG